MAVANRSHHLDVKKGALREALRFHKFPGALELFFPPFELLVNRYDRTLTLLGRHDIVRLRIDRNPRQIFLAGADLPSERIDLPQRVNLLAPHLDAVSVVFVSGIDLDHIAANTKGAAAQIFGAVVLHIDEAAQERFA